MPYENLVGTIPPAVISDVTTKMNEIITALEPYVVNLSVEERSDKYKMGPNRNSLVQKAIIVCDTHPQLVPNYVNVPDLKDDYNEYGTMSPMRQLGMQIVESIDDTMMARGSEALTNAVKPLYANVKAAKDQNVAGADAAYELLNPYYDLPDQPDGGNP